jgi:hypothetical protein
MLTYTGTITSSSAPKKEYKSRMSADDLSLDGVGI